MTPNGKKLQKNPSGNTALDKESIVELIKILFEEEFAKQQQQISKIIEKKTGNHKARNWKATRDKRFEKKY